MPNVCEVIGNYIFDSWAIHWILSLDWLIPQSEISSNNCVDLTIKGLTSYSMNLSILVLYEWFYITEVLCLKHFS